MALTGHFQLYQNSNVAQSLKCNKKLIVYLSLNLHVICFALIPQASEP